MSASVASLHRFVLNAKALHRGKMEHEALERYPWPLILRAAGYITAVSATASMLTNVGSHPPMFVAVLALSFAFTKGFHVLSQEQCVTTPLYRIAVVGAQVVIAVVLMLLSFCMGSELLLYVVAAEVQFVFSFQSALLATLGLLILDDVVYIVSGVKSPIPGGSAQFLLASPAGFAFVAAFTRGAVAELVQRYEATKLLDELNEAHAQLRSYADQVERLVARERNRMAREIHDTLGHYLTVINVQIEMAQKLRDRDAASSADALVTAKQLATECLNEVRRSVSALRPAALEDGGLLCAVDLLVEGLRGAAEFAIHLDVEGDGRLPVETEVTVYRAIQEALTNARKHARARNVWIVLAWEDDRLVATIRDDGQGTKNGSTADTASFGLQAMRERLSRVGGVLDIETGDGGFCVTVTVPLVQRLEAVPS